MLGRGQEQVNAEWIARVDRNPRLHARLRLSDRAKYEVYFVIYHMPSRDQQAPGEVHFANVQVSYEKTQQGFSTVPLIDFL